jgi:hypothetical protein
MSRKIKFLILLWFIFSWLLLFAVSLKPTGTINTIKLMLKPLLRNIHIPQELVLCDFEVTSDFSNWYWRDIVMESSEEHVYRGRHSAKVTYKANSGMPSLILEEHNLGPAGEKDWSNFKLFKFTVFNPQDFGLSMHLKIKDKAGRYIDRILNLKEGKNNVVLNLENVGQFIDLANIIYLNLYFIQPGREIVFYLDDVHLERVDLKAKKVLGKPIVNIVRLSCPKEVKRGESIVFSASLSINKELKNDYRVFIHISNFEELNKNPSQRRNYINADQELWIPTSKWVVNTPYEIGPISVYIPKGFLPGEYAVQMGLFNPGSAGIYDKGSTCEGMMDFRTSFPRLRYIDSRIKDFIVARFRVLD